MESFSRQHNYPLKSKQNPNWSNHNIAQPNCHRNTVQMGWHGRNEGLPELGSVELAAGGESLQQLLVITEYHSINKTEVRCGHPYGKWAGKAVVQCHCTPLWYRSTIGYHGQALVWRGGTLTITVSKRHDELYKYFYIECYKQKGIYTLVKYGRFSNDWFALISEQLGIGRYYQLS